jgi:ABC-type multidrug transport system fused ATPase/permease subunit
MTPAIKHIVLGKEAAQRIFEVIDRIPKILISNGGVKLEKIKSVELRNISFAYPKDKSKKILNGLSLTFDSLSSALVG